MLFAKMAPTNAEFYFYTFVNVSNLGSNCKDSANQ